MNGDQLIVDLRDQIEGLQKRFDTFQNGISDLKSGQVKLSTELRRNNDDIKSICEFKEVMLQNIALTSEYMKNRKDLPEKINELKIVAEDYKRTKTEVNGVLDDHTTRIKTVETKLETQAGYAEGRQSFWGEYKDFIQILFSAAVGMLVYWLFRVRI